MLQVPLIAISARNQNSSCLERGLTGQDCQYFEAGKTASLQLTTDQAKLSPDGYTEYCPGICEHDMAWVKADYVYQIILKYSWMLN